MIQSAILSLKKPCNEICAKLVLASDSHHVIKVAGAGETFDATTDNPNVRGGYIDGVTGDKSAPNSLLNFLACEVSMYLLPWSSISVGYIIGE